MTLDEARVTEGTEGVIAWWLSTRQKNKFVGSHRETISVNPFLLPLVAALHGVDDVEELGEVLIAAHLIGGHNTGFGKLFDEKLLPQVFGTSKLDSKFRAATAPYSQSAFNDIDHIVHRDGFDDLLSLKASPWTINLGGARDLNKSFELIRLHHVKPYPGKYGEIAMGVLYGSQLTDKYQILRGETQRQRNLHDVVDITDTVNVYAGRAFWSWLNDGEDATQEWVLSGVLKAAATFKEGTNQKELISALVGSSAAFASLLSDDGQPDWSKMLRSVNG